MTQLMKWIPLTEAIIARASVNVVELARRGTYLALTLCR